MADKDNAATRQVDTKALELIQEFYQFYDKMAAEDHPDVPDMDKVFQGWAIQKIAGLQVVVTNLARRVDAAGNAMKACPYRAAPGPRKRRRKKVRE